MASDPDKPLLRLTPQAAQDRPVGRQRIIPKPEPFPVGRQVDQFSAKFNRLAEVLSRDGAGLELRSDPSGLAPERLFVFEVRGAVSKFATAVRKVPGLELVDEEELETSDGDKSPIAYLMVPDSKALTQLASLWKRWLNGTLIHGETPWSEVFSLLKNLRQWGPLDRVQPLEASILEDEIFGHPLDHMIRLEVELIFRQNGKSRNEKEEEVRKFVQRQGGRIVSATQIEDISYHALLVELPVSAVQLIIERTPDGLAALEPVLRISPQSVADGLEVVDASPGGTPEAPTTLGAPILALLDGVPVAGHALLTRHLIIDDQFGLEPAAPVAGRVHGTAMASLILHGDRNRPEPGLPRRLHVVPVLGVGDTFPANRLIVDMIYAAVRAMREGPTATAPGVLLVNLSLGNARRPFHGHLSAWARLLDRLAYQYGILFLVSAGNCLDPFAIPAFANNSLYEDARPERRAEETLRALGAVIADRKLFSPAETVNGLTIGAWNGDAVTTSDRATARVNVDPYGDRRMSNPSSALGPGFALSVKPDILLPGAREYLRFVRNHRHIEVAPARPMRAAGLRVAAPPRDGRENLDGYTNGTSAATALASRTAHRIHDALEFAYGNVFASLTHVQRAVLIKALLAHTAKWPDEAAQLIRQVIGPPDGKHHVRQKDNIRRFLGFGIIEPDDAVGCASDRATFWATGLLHSDKISVVNVPLPVAITGQSRPHFLSATLAWFTPTAPGRRSYRSVRLKLLEPAGLSTLRVSADGNQPDGNQTNRGTVFMRRWTGDRAPVVAAGSSISLTVQRDPDQGQGIDEAVPFGLAVTLAMPGVLQIYEEIRQRLALGIRAPA
ncbi:S8 family peptidase [Azorhizobium doebereinerae]|uniref:S8 family peptidase n=1 Tax=Azorhizobium doebereinerae TaxID=281091 RepID=UPI0003FF6364|nr:S8 family peptidase [Azorhizobium doebereinerae]